MQLVEGPNEYEGRVEFCSNRGWAQVCGSGTWGQIPASLVCLQRSSSQCEFNIKFSKSHACIVLSIQLLFPPAFNTIVTSGYYGVDNLTMNSVNIRQTRCIPSGSFSDCVNMEIQNQGCSGGLLASVACPGMQDILYNYYGTVQLVEGPNGYEGRVSIYGQLYMCYDFNSAHNYVIMLVQQTVKVNHFD